MLFESVLLDVFRLLPSQKLLHEKKKMREILLQKRRMITKEQVSFFSDMIVEHIESMPIFQSAKTVLLYYPIKNEVNMLPLIKKYKKEKTFLFPVVHRRHMTVSPYEGNSKMHRGKFNIPEPTTEPYIGSIDMILVPGVAFDDYGNRLGRGGGYYDKFIRSLKYKSTFVGVLFDFQLVEKVPCGRWDKQMDYLVAPSKGIIKTKRN